MVFMLICCLTFLHQVFLRGALSVLNADHRLLWRSRAAAAETADDQDPHRQPASPLLLSMHPSRRHDRVSSNNELQLYLNLIDAWYVVLLTNSINSD